MGNILTFIISCITDVWSIMATTTLWGSTTILSLTITFFVVNIIIIFINFLKGTQVEGIAMSFRSRARAKADTRHEKRVAVVNNVKGKINKIRESKAIAKRNPGSNWKTIYKHRKGSK